MTNQDEDFYKYMGRFFGSRTIEKKINDRIYDDDSKEWYIAIEEGKVMAFVSINKNIIKNIYSSKDQCLQEILKAIKKENQITYSTVTNKYTEIYEKCGFKVSEGAGYKNFVIIYMESEEEIA